MIEKFKREAFIEKLENEVDVITLKSVHGKTAAPVRIYPARNKQGKYLGVIENPTDQQRNSGMTLLTKKNSVEVYDGITFDLSDEREKAYWDLVKYSVIIGYTHEEAQFTPAAAFYIYIEERISDESVSKDLKILDAKTLIHNDTKENLINRTKIIGLDMSGDTENAIKHVLLEMAENNPDKIIELYGASLAVHMLFHKALDQKLIYMNKDNMYQFMNKLLGSSKDDSIAFISRKDNDELLSILKERVEGKKEETKDSLKPNQMKNDELVKYITDNSDYEVEGLKRGDLMSLFAKLKKEEEGKAK